MKSVLLAATIALATSGAAAAASPIYSNNFTVDTQGFTTGPNASITTSPSSENFLEIQNGASTMLTLDTAGYVGGTVNVAFTLDVVGSMDGVGNTIQGGGIGDYFTATSGGATLLHYALANYGGGNTQTYPTAGSSPGSGAAKIDSLGYSGFPDSGNGIQDSIYDFSFSLSPTSASTEILFTSSANEAQNNEFYGIDNVTASATAAMTSPVAAAPEPGAWALMLGGAGAMGLMLRRRRTAGAAA